uniref:Protein kinase domain-containing protein n=1 Tax=Heterorhabditis bacteriophora TaxID=37862 RepID=A0A1I7X6H1_HETBA
MHRRQNIAVSEDIILGRPIPKQPWELSKEKITMEVKLGEGAFGEVWKGKMQHSGNSTVDVAIKVVSVKFYFVLKKIILVPHFHNYYRRNVVAFYGMVIDNDNVMIIMEMVRGGGLDHHLKKNPDKIVKISDFGLSKQADSYKIPPTEMTPIRWWGAHRSSATIPNKKSVGSVVTPSKKPIQSVRKSTISEQSMKHKTKPHSKKSSTHMKIKSMSSVKDTRKKSAVVPKNKTSDPSREKSCANKRRH